MLFIKYYKFFIEINTLIVLYSLIINHIYKEITMKHFRNYFIFGLVLMFGLAFVGCDKEKSPTAPTAEKPKSPTIATFTGPNTQSTNTYALEAKSFSQMFNGFGAQFSAYANIPGATQNGNTWTYTYTVQGFTETITTELLGDGSSKWKIIFNGTEPGGSVTFVNWVVMEGTSSADGKSGSLKFYENNSTTLEAEISWTTDAQGNESGIMKTYTNGVTDNQIEVVNNIDGTGSMKVSGRKTGTTTLYLIVEISWLANGTGSYTSYTEAGVATTGTF